MNNLCRFGNIALEGRKTSLACCNNVRCKSAQGEREKPKGKIKKDKTLRFKRCCQSETKRNLDQHRDEASVVLKALHAVDVLNPRPTTPLERCRSNGFNSILESVNFIAATPELILPESNQKDYSRRGYHSKNVDDVRDNAEVKPQERAYIINVFLNDQKPPQNEVSDEDCLDVHIKDIDVTPDEVCMRKLTENIHKNYDELDKILAKDVDAIGSKDYLTNELKRVWSDVFKRSKSEEAIPLKQLKDDDYIEEKPQVELNANQELNSKDNDEDSVEKQSSSRKGTEAESIRPNPVLIASRIDEVIRSNALYKKNRSKRNKITKSQKAEPRKEIPIQIEETPKRLPQELSTKFVTDINVINPKGEEIKFNETQPPPILNEEEVPIAPTPSVRVKDMVQNIEKIINLKEDNTKLIETLLYKSEPKSADKATPRSQEIFDPDPFIDEINQVMLEKSLIEEQFNKTKLNEKISNPESKPDLPITKKIKREWIEVLPQSDNSQNLTTTRPVTLRGQQRLKHQSTNVQKQIDDVIKKSAESRFHNPENTFQKIVNFWQGFFRENPEGTSSGVYSTKFIKEEAFIDRHTKPTKLAFSENPTTMATQFRPITTQITPKTETKKKPIYKDNRNKSDLNQAQIASIVSADEIFGSQYAFQQKSGIRERILPSPQINLFKNSHKKLSYFRGKIDLKRFYSDECKDDRPICKQTDECEKQGNKCESEEEIKKISNGVLGCTAKCLTNRVPNEPADPDPVPELCPQDDCDPRIRTQVKPIEPKCDIMDKIGQYVNNEKAGEAIECYYGDNGYKNLEYFKFYPTSFYDIQRHLANKRNPQPDAYAHKRAKPKTKKKNPCECLK